MRASGVRGFALVHVVAECRLDGIHFEPFVASALESPVRVRTFVRAVVGQFQTFVDVDAGGVVV